MPSFIRPAGALIALTIVLSSTTAGAQAPAASSPPSSEQTIRGRITAIDGPFNIRIHDDRGYTDNIELHRGTIINPTGLTLAVAMHVRILGYNAGAVFEANQIDTPYSFAGPPPIAAYYGPGWWYPGYVYGYGPSFSLNFQAGRNLYQSPFPHSHSVVGPPAPRPPARGPFVGSPPPGRRR